MFNKMTPEKVREMLNKANMPTYMGPKQQPIPKVNNRSKLSNAASSIVKGGLATIPVLGQTTAQTIKDTTSQFADEDFQTARMNQAIAQTDPSLTEARFNQSRYGLPLPINKNLQSATQQLEDARISTPIDLDSIGGRLMQSSNDEWQQATGKLPAVPKFLADTGRSIVENVATLPLAAINPSLPLAAMGARAAASKTFDLSQQGLGASEALGRGLLSGGIEAVTEKIPLENVLRLGKVGSKKAIKELLKQAKLEATEESASYVLNYLADKAHKDPNATFSLQELALSAAGGALSGGVMGGGAMAINRVANRQPSLPQATKQGPSLPQIQSQAIVNEQVKKANNRAILPIQEAASEAPQQVKPMQPMQSVEPIIEPDPVVQAIPQPAQKTKTVRKTNIPAITFDEYIKARGIDRSQIANEIDQAEYIGGMLTETTKAGKGKAKSHGKKIAFTNQLQKEYQQAIDSGEIATIEKESNLNWDNESDRAYARMAIKRANKKGDADTANAWQAFYDSEFGTAPNLPLARSQNGTLPQATNNNIPTQAQPIVGQNEASQEYGGLVDEYGAIPKGEKSFREADVPKQTKDDNRTSRFVRTALEAEATPDNIIEPVKKAIEKDAFSYQPISDVRAMNYAKETISNKTYEGALRQWQGLVESNKFPSKNDIVLGELLYKEAAQAGDFKTAMRTLAEVASAGTRLGQSVQALRSLKKMTPDGQLYAIQKSVDNINEDLKIRYKEKAPEIKISEQLAEKLLKSETLEQLELFVDEINKDIGQQVPVTWLDKWNAWRYLSMLGNPRTHIRNLVGNAIFIPARKFKNIIGAGIEKAVLPQSQRTKAILTSKDKGLVEFSKEDFTKNAQSITRNGKYNPADAIRENRQIFDNKVLEFLRKFNFDKLEKEDIYFLRGAYANSLAGWIKAKGKTAETISITELEQARNYATQEALKATYRDASKTATALNKFSKANKASNLLIEGILPFKKTPINILKRGIEYSPAGVFKSVYDMTTQVRKGNMTATEAIDELASGLSGSAIMLLGAYLASQGLVAGGGEEDKRERDFGKMQGIQNYALKIGNTSYTIDWMAPISLPLFVGVETFNAFKEENATSGLTEFIDGMVKITEPMFNLSMLQGVSGIIQSAVYAKGNPLPDIGMNIATNYVGQANPTLLGQIARTADDTRRNAYYNDKTVDLPQVAQIAMKRNLAKIPDIPKLNKLPSSKDLPAYVDQWGREEKEPNLVKRTIENFLSPGYISKDKSTPTDKELEAIFKRTGEKSVIPNIAPKYFNVGEKRVDLNAKQYVTYAKAKGQKSYEYVTSLINNKSFRKLSDENKVKVIEDAYGIANSVAKTRVSLYKMDSAAQKALQATKAGVSMGEYLILKNTANIDKQGSIRQEEAQEILDKTKLTNKQKSVVWKTFNSSWKYNPYE